MLELKKTTQSKKCMDGPEKKKSFPAAMHKCSHHPEGLMPVCWSASSSCAKVLRGGSVAIVAGVCMKLKQETTRMKPQDIISSTL